MKIDLGKGSLCLDENQPLRLQDARGQRIVCLEGTIWITVPGLVDDIFLTAGEHYCLPSDGAILIEGAPQGRIMVNPESRQPFARLCCTLFRIAA